VSEVAAEIVFFPENNGPEPLAVRFEQDRLHRCVLPLFETEQGVRIKNLSMSYRVFGAPSPFRDNVVLVLHALTGDTNCAGHESAQGRRDGWWEGLFAPNGALPLDRYCVICANHPGGCYGSSGPMDTPVGGSEPLGPDFPLFTPRDFATAQSMLLHALGIDRLRLCIGGSLGGMVALEMLIMFPKLAEAGAVIAVGPATSAQALAFNHVQRRCFDLDPNYKGGRYYGGPRPSTALSIARQTAMITYRSAEEFDQRFGRALTRVEDNDRRFEIQRYLEHHGEKLLCRFDAGSYLSLLKTLDAHDVFRGRGDPVHALEAVRARVLFISVSSDFLFPKQDIFRLAEMCRNAGVDVTYREIESIFGHDGFLVETEQLNQYIFDFGAPGQRSSAYFVTEETVCH
jgi:homoserine O-acetyltransferase